MHLLLLLAFTEATNSERVDAQTPFHLAAKHNRCRAMQTFWNVTRGIGGDGTVRGLCVRDAAEEIPLHEAVRRGHVDMCRILIAMEPSQIRFVGNGLWTPLHLAAAQRALPNRAWYADCES